MILIIHLVLSLIAPSSFSASREAFITPYLEIQTTLAKDSIEGVKEKIPQLVRTLSALGQKQASLAAKQMEGSKSIAEYRDRFQKVSELLLPWMKKHKIPGLILAYCPMKKAYWLQAKGDLRNPYYGAEMLECGVEEEQK